MPTIKFEIKVLFFIFYSAWPTTRNNDITNREKTDDDALVYKPSEWSPSMLPKV